MSNEWVMFLLGLLAGVSLAWFAALAVNGIHGRLTARHREGRKPYTKVASSGERSSDRIRTASRVGEETDPPYQSLRVRPAVVRRARVLGRRRFDT